MSNASQFGLAGSQLGDIKYKAVADAAKALETINSQEWLRCGYQVAWNAKYAAQASAVGRGLYGYTVGTTVSTSGSGSAAGATFKLFYAGGNYYAYLAASAYSAATLFTFATPGGSVTSQSSDNISGTAFSLLVNDLAVVTTGGSAGKQIVAVFNGSNASKSVAAYRTGTGAWSLSTTTAATGSAVSVACKPDGSHALLIANTYNGNNYTSTDQGNNWTSHSASGTGSTSRYLMYSSVLSKYLSVQAASSVPLVSTSDGITWTQETMSGYTKNLANAQLIVESATAVIAVGTDLTGNSCLHRNTGTGGWNVVSLPAALAVASALSVAYSGSTWWMSALGATGSYQLYTSSDDGLTWSCFGYVPGANSSAAMTIANGQMFVPVVNGSGTTVTLTYTTQALPGATPDRVGYYAPINGYAGGGGDSPVGFVRIL